MSKSNKKSTAALVVKCSDGAFRKLATVESLGVDWTPPGGGLAGAVFMKGRFILGTYDPDTKVFVAA